MSLMTKGDPERRVVDVGVNPLVDEGLSWRMDNVIPFNDSASCDRDDDCADLIASWARTTGRTTRIDAE